MTWKAFLDLAVFGHPAGYPSGEGPIRAVYCFNPCKRCGLDIGGYDAVVMRIPYTPTFFNRRVYHPECFAENLAALSEPSTEQERGAN